MGEYYDFQMRNFERAQRHYENQEPPCGYDYVCDSCECLLSENEVILSPYGSRYCADCAKEFNLS